MVWRESHAPSTAVQWSQEELLRNVTAITDGTAQTPAAATASLCRPEPRKHQTPDLLWNTSRLFLKFYHRLWKYTISGICLPVTATEDDSSEKHHISLCGSSS